MLYESTLTKWSATNSSPLEKNDLQLGGYGAISIQSNQLYVAVLLEETRLILSL